MTITREELALAAEFAGLIPLNAMWHDLDDNPTGIDVQRYKNGPKGQWLPLKDCRDCGPLLCKVKAHIPANNLFHGTDKFLSLPTGCRQAIIDLDVALTTGNEQSIREATVRLAAAIQRSKVK